MAEAVEVTFGASTSGLDNATDKAKSDVKDFQGSIASLNETVQLLATAMIGMAEDMKTFGESSEDAQEDVEEFQEELEDTDQKTNKFGNTIRQVAGYLIAFFSVREAINWTQRMGEAAVAVDQLSQRMGMSREEASGWQYVMEQANLSTETLTTSQQALSTRFVEALNGNRAYRDTFQALGIELDESKTSHELLLETVDKFSQMEDGPRKTALAVELLGRSGAQLIPVFNEGREAIEATMQAGIDTGAVVNDEFVNAGIAVDNAFDDMMAAAAGFSNQLFVDLAPAIITIVNAIADLIKNFNTGRGEIGETSNEAAAFSEVLRIVAATIAGVANIAAQAWNVVQIGLQGLIGTVLAFNAALAALPLGIGAAKAEFDRYMEATAAAINDQIATAASQQEGFNEFYTNLWAESDARAGQELSLGQGAEGGTLAPPPSPVNEDDIKNQIAALTTLQQARQDDYAAWVLIQEEKLRIAEQYYGAESEQYQRLLQEKMRADEIHSRQLEQIRQSDLQSERQIAQTRIQVEQEIAETRLSVQEQSIARMRARGQITAQQEVAMLGQVLQQKQALEVAHENRMFQLQMSTLQAALASENLRPIERARILNEIEVLEAQHAGRVAVIREQHTAEAIEQQARAADAIYQKWQSALQPLGSGLSNMFQQMYQGSATFEQAFLQMLDKMLFAFVDMAIKMGINWAANQAAQTSAAAAGAATRQSIAAGEKSTSLAMSGATALGDIANSAARAAAAAYASVAAIPIIGPFLAPALAVAALGAVLAFGSSIISARKGLGRVDKDGQMAELHKDEMVLPADIAEPLRQNLAMTNPGSGGLAGSVIGATANGGPTTNNGGDQHFTYAPKYEGGKRESVVSMLRRDGQGMRKWLREEFRSGRLAMEG